MNNKLKGFAVLFLSVTAIAVGGVFSTNQVFSSQFSSAAGDPCQHKGNHYTRKDATEQACGCKEYWVCCDCHEHYITTPDSGTWINAGVATLNFTNVDYTDSRYIAQLAHTHKDANKDYVCDECGDPIEHSHVDKNPRDDHCDLCGLEMAHVHYDDNSDYHCDGCGAEIAHDHTDKDGDGYCDLCHDIMSLDSILREMGFGNVVANADGTYTVGSYSGDESSIIIPEGVSGIQGKTFQGNSGGWIVLPESIGNLDLGQIMKTGAAKSKYVVYFVGDTKATASSLGVKAVYKIQGVGWDYDANGVPTDVKANWA